MELAPFSKSGPWCVNYKIILLPNCNYYPKIRSQTNSEPELILENRSLNNMVGGLWNKGKQTKTVVRETWAALVRVNCISNWLRIKTRLSMC